MSIFTFSNSRSLLQKTTFLVVRLFIVVALILPQISSAQFNAQINYQGKLLGSGNSAAANGNYNVRFKIYNVATGGSPLWTETWCYSTDSGATCTGSGTDSRVALTSGLFSVMLGSTTPFSGIDFNQTLYLGVDIGGSGATPTWDGEMLPRKKMGAVPAAFVAQTLDGLRKEQFLRTDATNATNTASTFVTLSQAGAGDIARFIGASGANVLTVKSGGGVGIGSTTPQNMLGIERTTGNTLVDIKTNDSSTAAINFINNLNTWQAGISTYGVNAGGFNIGDRSTGSSVVRFAIAPTTGNVGIGTTSPFALLSVAGSAYIGGNLTATGTVTLGTLTGPLQALNGLVSATSTMSIAYGGTGLSTAPTYGQVLLGQANGTYALVSTSSLGITGSGSSFSYLFPSNATSTLLSFTGGLISGASTTIGSGTQAGGLTISGGATTTGNAYFAGNVGIGTTSPESLLDVDGIGTFGTENASTAQLVVKGGAAGGAMVTLKRTVGAPSQFSWLLSGGGLTFADNTNGFNVTNIFGDNSQNQLFIGQRGKIVSDSRVSLLSGTTFSSTAGSDVAASELRIQGGLGTGAGTPGDVSFYTGTTLGSGSTAQSGSSRMVIKGNTGFVGIGTSTPNTRLTVTTSGSNGINLDADTSSPTLSGRVFFTSSSNSYAIMNSAGFLQLRYGATPGSSSGTIGFTMDSSGNVGIGTSTPGYKLDVLQTGGASSARFQNSASINAVDLDSTFTGSTGDNVIRFLDNGTTRWAIGNNGSNSDALTFANSSLLSSTPRMVLTTAGDLGVGTSTPYAKLSVTNTGTGPSFVVEDSTSPDQTPFVIDASGNVAIGTSTAAAKLHIDVASTGGFSVNTNDASGRAEGSFLENGTTMAIMQWRGSTNASFPNTFRFGTNVVGGNTTITAGFGSNLVYLNGTTLNVGIGTSTPQSKLHVLKSAGPGGYSSADDLIVESSGSTDLNLIAGASNTANLAFSDGTRAVGLVSYNHSNNSMRFDTNSTERMLIDSSGNIGIGTTTPRSKLTIVENLSGQYGALSVWAASGAATDPLVTFWGDTKPETLRATFLRNGNFGLGTSTPISKLTITEVGSTDILTIEDKANDNTPLRLTSAGRLYLNASSTEATTSWNGVTPDLMVMTADHGASNTNGMLLFGGGNNRKTSFIGNEIQVNFTNSGRTAGLNLMPNLVAGSGVAIGTTTNNWLAYLSIQGTTTSNSTANFSSFNSAGTNILKLTDAGNLGIGSSTPFGKLSVSVTNAGNVNDGLIIERGSGTNAIGFKLKSDADGLFRGAITYKNATQAEEEVITIGQNSGANYIGIGTTTPYERLAVVGTVVADRFVATSTTATSTFAGGIRVTSGGAQISNLTSCDSLDTDASGNLICGTDAGAGTSPWLESAGVIAPSSANSRVVIGTLSGVTNTALSVFATSSGTTGLVVRGAANQTANFATFQDSTGKAVASINNRGGLSIDVSSTDIVKNTNSTGLSTDFDFTGSTLTNITTTAGQNFIDVTEGTIPASGQGQWVATTTVTAAALGAGGFVISREDGRYLVVHGGGSATASVWDGVTGGTMSALSQNVVSTGLVGAGAIALRRPDGRYLLIHGGGANATTIFDPYARTPAVAGPTLGGLCTTGTNAFLRADGLYVIMCGGTTSWGTYNPSTNTYAAGIAVGTAFGAGAHAIMRDNNTFLVFAGGNTNTHYGYNPFAAPVGTMTAGVITANAPVIDTGAFSIRRNEGKFLVIGGAINASTIYNPTETSSNSGWGTMTTQTVSAGFGPTQALADGAQAVWRQDGKYLLLLGGSTATNIIDPSKSDSLQFTTGPALASAAGTGATMFMVPDGTYALVRGGGTAVDIYDAGFVVGGQQYGTRLASYESECITSTSLNPYSSLTWTASGEGRVVVQVRVGIGSCTGNYTQLQSNGDKIPYLDGANRVQFRIFLQRALPKFNDQEWGIRRQNITRYRRNKSDPTIYDLVLRNDNMFKRSLYEFGANVNATSSASSSVPVIVNLSNRVDGVGLGYSSVSNPEYNTLANTTNLAAFNPTFASSTQLTVPVATSSIVMKRPDGRFIILSGATTTTNVAQLYNPVDRSITTNGSQPSAAPGPGALAFKRPDGKFFIVIGNNNTTTIIYDPVGDTFSAGPALTANAGRGAFAIPLPNGQILIGLGAGGTATSVYDPIQNTMKSGPVSTVTLGGGTMALPRPDGTYIVFSGTTDACALSTATALFNPATMAFRINTGVSVTTGLGPGAYAFQRTDGLWVIVHGGGTATTCTATNRTAIYNPVTNGLVAGPTFATMPSLGSRVDGNFAIPTADGNWALIQAGATTTASRVWLYLEKYGTFSANIHSQIGVMVSSYTVNAVNGPNATISGTGPGAIAFQQDDGRFFTLAGGHAPNLLPRTAASSTDRTYMIDAGWVSSGLYKSEAMFVPDLDANSVINWKSTSYKGLSVEVRTATSMDGLQTATARQIETSGGLINPGVGEKWVQFNFNFSRTFPSYRGIYTDVWYNGATPVHTQRTIDSPVLSEVTITKDTDFLNLKMDGLSVFRISSNGNVFLTDGATVNTSGADLAERYSSRQQLKPGEVVSIDPINNHAVQRTTHQYQNDVIGIVSTDPGFVAGAYTEDSYPIALVGRVPVKVSTENGMIKAGDRLTPSSVPGHAMKASLAGRVVGKALESLDASKLEACPSSDIIIPGRKCGTVMVFMNLIDYSGETIDDAILNWETVQKELLRQQDIQTVQVSVLDGGIEAEFESDPLSDITIGISTSSMMSTTTRSARVLSFLEDLKKERESVAASRSEVFVDRVSAVNEVIAPSFLAKALRAETVDGAQIISARIEAGDIETARLLVRGKNSDIVFGEDGQVFLMRKATSSNATTTAGVSTSTALLLTEALALPPGTLISFTDDGGAFFAGELVARGLKTESLTVEGLTTLSGGLLVSSIGTKEGELKVMADTFFAGRAYFNSDSAGDALIPRGGKEVAIKFVKPFAEKPVVNANFSFNESTTTPEQEDEIFRQDIRFVITRRSPEGFRITLNKPAPLDVLFSWTAVGVKDKTTFNGVGAQGLTIFEPQKMHPTTSLPIILTTPQEQLVLISTSTVPVSTTTPASESPSQDSTVSSTEQVQNAPTQIDQGGVILQADPTPAPAPVEVSTPESVATPAVESVPAE